MFTVLYESISSVSAPFVRLTCARRALTVAGTALLGCALGFSAWSLDAEASTETVLYSFGNGTDGQWPNAGLIEVGGTLYGTTSSGGAYGGGTVFAFNPATNAETVLYSFCSEANCADGDAPGYGSLIEIKGILYGTTRGGGIHNCNADCGTVFAFNPATNAETVLYSFAGPPTDGRLPDGGLIKIKDALYGTTFYGGTSMVCSNGCGTVFSLDRKANAETMLYSFQGYPSDGTNPTDGMINVGGTLYGTTRAGGGEDAGTVFSINPQTGAQTVVYSFCPQQGCNDATVPYAGLINVEGTLYGTASEGGGYGGNGAVFSLNPQTGTEAVVYGFGQYAGDAVTPFGSLVRVRNRLYGTTFYGGTYAQGAVFSINLKTNKEKVLWSFGNGSDGATPYAGLIDVNGTLYGTTSSGGTYGHGAVYSIVP